MRPALIIFDCDGVIVDSEGMAQEVLRDQLARHGLKMTLDNVTATFIGSTTAGVAAKARDMGARLPPDWPARFDAELDQRLAQGVPLIAGIPALLDRLDVAALPYCLASNGRRAKMQTSLGQHDAIFSRLRHALFSADEVARPKPAPDLFLHAAARMGHAPERCVVIEDSPTGARAARAAGMRCFGYAPEGDGARLVAEGARVFDDMAQLPEMLGL